MVGVDVSFENPVKFQAFRLDPCDQRIGRGGVGAPRRLIVVEHRIDHRASGALRVAHHIGHGVGRAVEKGLDKG